MVNCRRKMKGHFPHDELEPSAKEGVWRIILKVSDWVANGEEDCALLQ